MTKTIDPKYVLDEVELLGLLVERVAEHTGLLRTGESIHGVRLQGEHSTRFIAGLFAELRERRDTRARTRNAPALRHQRDPWIVFEEILESLQRMPTLDHMRAILVAHRIEEAAAEMKIENQLIHTAVAAGPRGVRQVPSNLSDEEFDKYVDSWAPYLPDAVRDEWNTRMEAIRSAVGSLDEEALIRAYESYLRWVLDSYAVGTNRGGFMHLSSFNERAEREDFGIWPGYKDTYWRRSVEIVPVPEYDSTKPSHAASQTTSNQPINPKYRVNLRFEPRAVLEASGIVSLWDTRTGTPPKDILDRIAEVKDGYHFVATLSAGLHGEGTHAIGVGQTILEAYVDLFPPHHATKGRPLTPEEMNELRVVSMVEDAVEAHAMGVEAAPSRSDTTPPNVARLTSEVTDFVHKLSPAKLQSLRDVLFADAKYGDPIPQKIEFVAEKGFNLTPKYRIVILTSDPPTGRQTYWYFPNREEWIERAQLLSGLNALRLGSTREERYAPPPIDETSMHYTMAYTMDELHTIFGPFEELT